ncbi:hypothetical protein EFT43_10035 [Leuconostoc falkenbergense]|uniref:hypothetical protein n=1 Tax=Leuconostoc falkenbergense TaxID=2766470 RepID=UPI00166A1C55|nr:hypothetical protein [Leuconostoc falkenbergense]MCT4405232.1 hypothetical protein [Leuconostoc falkenbergense]
MINTLLDKWDGGRSLKERLYDLFFIAIIAAIGHLDFWHTSPKTSMATAVTIIMATVIALLYLLQLPRLKNNSDVPYKLTFFFYVIYVISTFILTSTLTRDVLALSYWPRLATFVIIEAIMMTRVMHDH